MYPQELVNVRLPAGFDWRHSAALKDMQMQVERELDGHGRVLIRPSGTEPLLRVMVEASDATVAHSCAHRLADALRADFPV